MVANNQHEVQISVPNNGSSDMNNQRLETIEEHEFDYSKRSQWLRAALLGATDGLVSVASLMMGIGAVKTERKAMLLTGFAGLSAGACSMAIGELISVYSQRDIEKAQMKRDQKTTMGFKDINVKGEDKLPNPVQAAMASALAFSVGAVVPLLAAAFITRDDIRLGVLIAAVCVSLLVFGVVGAKLGNTPVMVSCARVLAGGLMAMGITYGLTKCIATNQLEM